MTDSANQNTGGVMITKENERAVIMKALRLLRLETHPTEDVEIGVAGIGIAIVGHSEAVEAILASGLVQDEVAIRADEREKCAKLVDTHMENIDKTHGDVPIATTILKQEVALEIANAIRSS